VQFGERKTASTSLQQYCYRELSLLGYDPVWVGEYLYTFMSSTVPSSVTKQYKEIELLEP